MDKLKLKTVIKGIGRVGRFETLSWAISLRLFDSILDEVLKWIHDARFEYRSNVNACMREID